MTVMKKCYSLKFSLFAFLLGAQFTPAGTITNIVFNTPNLGYQNDTIPSNGTSPIGFTNIGSLANPFLNNLDSSFAMSYGSYYAITPLGFGQHLGGGFVSFLLDGVTPFTQTVTFPAASPGGVIFATFSLPGGDSVQISTTGLSADRTRVVADGGGLVPDGFLDEFSLFVYRSGAVTGTPEPSSLGLAAAGLASLAVRLRRK